uniref:2-oxoglutarate-Fe(II) type oxidoreductase ppzD-like isoform X1 n=1 Tax=Styela clava TaxID=7725 RepID=UPI00193A3883|nr:2-oxoglutarate-Fe(II) type oxidoreductase ppzD-like isoform X1 [Styela clava]XP_039263974.1 2-oxoglutarate-Fe(II) type oxidoreductase ppzD-like isoform X1 [Styela clava]
MNVPVINFAKCGLDVDESDLNETTLQQVGTELYHAFSSSGFAYLAGAGISSENVKKVIDVSGRFFSLSREYKESFAKSDVNFGYDKIGLTRGNPNRPYDHQEGFHVSGKAYVDEELEWPDVPGFNDVTMKFAGICKQLSIRLLRALGKGMKLKDPRILEKSHKYLNNADNHTSLRLIYYGGIDPTETILPNQARVGEHSDWGTITLLFQDDVGGLQVRSKEGDFIDVKPISDTIVVNVGDMLSMWSDYDLKSTVHRVIIPNAPELRSKIRRSIAYFVNADDETVLSKFEYQSMENESSHEKNDKVEETMTALDFISHRYKVFFT